MIDSKTVQMIELRLSGKSYEEIGKLFGVSKQRVFQLIGGNEKCRRKVDEVANQKIKYVGLRNWMRDNGVSIARLTRLIYGHGNASTQTNTRLKIYGELEMPKSFIDKLIKITGLSYERLFDEEGERRDTE